MDKKLQEYAELIVRVGVNLQDNQRLVICCQVDRAYFARMLAKEAYKAGCREVVMRWIDDEMDFLRYSHAKDDVFDEFPKWFQMFFNEHCEQQSGYIYVDSTDPELLKDVDPSRMQRFAKARGAALKDYQSKQMANYFPWCVVSVPSEKWATKVFPGVPVEDAISKLWNAILTSVHVSNGSAVKTWQDKVATAQKRADVLNNHNFSRLVYKNSLGTDLTIDLPEKHMWEACGSPAGNGVSFVANMPTEEIFTLPKKDGVNGTVYCSKPLIVNGNAVEGIRFVFKDGKIVEADAKSGLDHLMKSIDTDAGARFLGEVALVPYHSPISEMNIVFYNTLFDENASCHLAYGRAYPLFLDVAERTEDELFARGMNDSIVHEDFMIGTSDLSIVGITSDGKQIPVFVNGDFAF